MNLERPADDDNTRPAAMIDAKVNSIYDQILEEICTELIFHVEIEASINLSIIKQIPKNEPSHLNDYDIFNNSTSKEIQECICPICERTVGAIRFAPHLEKCVGMGRVSSRIANRRLATAVSGKDVTGSKMLAEDASDSLSSQNDTDWTMSRSSRKSDRKKRVRPRRSKGVKKSSAADNGGTAVNNSGNSNNHSNNNNNNNNTNTNNNNNSNNNNNGHSNSNSSSNNNNDNNNNNNNNSNNSGSNNNNSNNVSPSIMDTITYNSMSLEERVTLLGSVCGVISEHTGRLCTRSIRCPKHTEQQRNNVRMTVLWSEMNEDFKNVTVRELKYTNNSQETLEVSNGQAKSSESSLDTSAPSTPIKRTRKAS